MPNWCEGWVKFRGTKANVVKMIESVFDGAKPEFFDNFVVAQIPTERVIRMRSLVRAIVEVADIEHANYSIWTNNEKALFIIKINHAWNVSRQGYSDFAKKYKLDIKGKCYESGMCFTEEFEYNSNGEELFYKVREYDDYLWECECPTLGG